MAQLIKDLLEYKGEPDLELAFDAEANGLLERVTKMWCLVFQDINTEEFFIFHNFPQFDFARVIDPHDNKEYIIPKRTGTLENGVQFMENRGKKLIAHNCFGYDHHLIKKFFPKYKMPLRRYVDTLTNSKVQWYDRPTPIGARGAHGLAAWGIRQGVHKPTVTDWTVMDPFKLHRCIEDVRIQTGTYKLLQIERLKLEELVGADIQEAINLENLYSYDTAIQEMDGACVDVPHMKACVKELDTFCDELRVKTEPLLPDTFKVKAVRATGFEVATLLGAKRVPAISYHWKQLRGEQRRVEIKRYYKPVMKWTNKVKVVHYSAVNVKLGIETGFMYTKLKDARQFVKDNHPETKEWKYPKVASTQEVYNNHCCSHFEVAPEDFEKDGKVILGAHTKIVYRKSTMSQHAVVKEFLLTLGWIPTEWNYKKDSKGKFERDTRGKLIKTSPMLTEDSYDSLPDGVGLDIANYNTYSHRRKFIENPNDRSKGLLNQVRSDGRIGCGINNFGTSTGRSSHSKWVNAAGVGALYGEKIRQIIIAKNEDYLLVGADMKSAQLSIAAYYSNNYSYYLAVADGQEEIDLLDGDGNIVKDKEGIIQKRYIGESGHCVNARAFGLVSEAMYQKALLTQDSKLLHEIMLIRLHSKRGTFATLFGASGNKVASSLGIEASAGEEARLRFLEEIGLDEPIARLKKMMKKYRRGTGGYIELPYGYWIYCAQEHKLFNYLDQGTEAICQKIAVLHFKKWLKKEVKAGNVEAIKILDYHDEFLCESHKDCVDEVGKAMTASYKYASDSVFEWHRTKSKWFNDLTFAFNLDGGYKVGHTYLDVH